MSSTSGSRPTPEAAKGRSDPGARAAEVAGVYGDELALSGSARLGRFYVLHKLGEGAMGAVYVAYDEQLDRRVALKLLHRGAVAHSWLLREGKALARLAHPNVVAVHDVGEHEGRVFLAMELVTGPTLRGWLAAGQRPFSELIQVFLQAGRGLAAAHEAGLVHRDFKPDNVLIGADGRARVADFGISVLTEEGPDAQDRMGTPAYMAPEQISGDGASEASDQWAFCVTLYRAAYGVPPFPMGDLAEIARSVLRDAPRPPPRSPDVPGWLAPILLRGLQRDPEARYDSMHELLNAISRNLPGDPELDPTPVRGQRAMVSAALTVMSLGGAGLMLTDEGARLLTRPLALVGVGLGFLAICSAVVAALWEKFGRIRYGRRIAGILVLGVAALCGHRLASVALGASAAQVLVGDAILISLLFGVLAVVDEPWLGWLSAVAATAALFGALLPAHAATAFGLAGLATAVVMGVRTRQDLRAGGKASPTRASGLPGR